jgi:serine/threonine-protein kinase
MVIDKGFVERFEHEARTAAKLEHPNIVPIYRVGRAGPTGEVIYFVMKLLRGQSLSAVLAERPQLEPSEVRRILTETAAALHYAAKRSVVHRDIKPDNIMLDSEGRCVITDFGIAKAPGGQQTTAGTSLGTPRYMSPEHAMGQPLDGRSDMYSLGIVAYQCLFGKAPFEADEPFAVLYKHIHEPVPEPTLANDEVRQLYHVIARMLAKNPDDRFQNGNELIAALGGQASDPSLVPATVAAPTLLAPTEVMPTPRPWSISRWRMMTRTRKVVYSFVVFAIAATGLAVALDLPQGAISSTASNGVSQAGAPPAVAGVTVTRLSATDSAALAPKGPSARAAAILKDNAYRSKCPQQDTVATAPRLAYQLLVDSIADRSQAESMTINYDVCGLKDGSPFQAHFKLTKLNQRNPLRRQDPISTNSLETAGSPRSRERYPLNISKASAGSYRLEVIIVDPASREAKATRDFQITERKP